MGHENSIDSRADRGLERRKFHSIEPRAVCGYDWNSKMRIDIGVAVTGKMLGCGEHPELMRTFDVRGSHPPHQAWILSIRARVNDRVVGVGIHVDVGKPIPLHAEGAGLHGSDAP